MANPLLTIAALLFVIFQLIAHFTCAEAVDLDACGTMLQQKLQNVTQSTTNTTAPPDLSISYQQCVAECGGGLGNVNWQGFSQDFGAWLLPWISLMFQIPFGAERKSRLLELCVVLADEPFFPTLTEPLDDVVSFLITIGSPALASYSLQITHLNKYWIHREFMDIRYPNSELIPTVLSAFHHIPIQIEHRPPFLHSLIVLSKNDDFWSHLAAANKTRRWSIPLVVTYILVVFSVLLSIVDSATSNTRSTGFGITCVWAFLLPLIIGWLHTGCEPEPSHLRNSLAAANQHAWLATGERDGPVRMTNPMAIEFTQRPDVDLARKDELRPVPVFNYSRAFITPATAELILRLVKNAATNAKAKIPAGFSVGTGSPLWLEGEKGDINPENRVGTDDEVTGYCTRVLDRLERNSSSITTLERRSSSMTLDGTYTTRDHGLVTPSRWAPGIWKRVVIASLLALWLQWGTTGAAIMVNYITPPVGFGCYSFSFLLYGILSTSSFLFFLASSIFAHMSRPVPGEAATPPRSRTFQNAGAVVCRWIGKGLGVISGVGILAACFFQVTGSLVNCFCTSTTFNRGRHVVTFVGPHFDTSSPLIQSWVAGLITAFTTSILFGFSLYMGLPPRRR